MRQPSNLRGISHGELVELADRLMSEMSDERFLPAYDAALAADNDAPLVKFCGQLLQIVLRRVGVREAQSQSSQAA